MKNNRKLVEDRQRAILNMVREQGEVSVNDLAETFQISLMTVRRDLQYLEEEKMLSRIHGGAVSLEKAHIMLSNDEKIAMCRERISEYASRFVESGDTLFINGSRTALDMLKYVDGKKVSVYTNNCWGIMDKYSPDVTLHFTGGELRSYIMVGEFVMRNLLSVTADKTFLGCAAVYADGTFHYNIPTEIGINEVMVSRTTKGMYILADHTKLKKSNEKGDSYGSCVYDQDCTLITDNYADKELVEDLRRNGVNVILVPVK